MFSDRHYECVGFNSSWKVKNVLSEISTQTLNYEKHNIHSETTGTQEFGSQTESTVIKSTTEMNPDELRLFIVRIYPLIDKELNKPINYFSFESHDPISDESSATSQVFQKIDVKVERQTKLKISSVSWNASSKWFAASLMYSHEEVCRHIGQILLYCVDADNQIGYLPEKKITCVSCVSAINFHCTNSNILAGYSLEGVLYLWNIQNKDHEMVCHKISGVEEFSSMQWIILNNMIKNKIFLVTAHLNRIITLWEVKDGYKSLSIHRSYKIRSSSNKKEIIQKERSVTGITCFDFPKHLPDVFIIGTESGSVIECSTSKAKVTPGDSKVYEPLTKFYQKHDAPVRDIRFSNGGNNLFLTTGMDMQTKIYILGEEDPTMTIFSNNLYATSFWVPNEKFLISSIEKGWNLQIYDVVTANKLTKKFIVSNEESESDIICQFNPVKPNIIVLATDSLLNFLCVPWKTFVEKENCKNCN